MEIRRVPHADSLTQDGKFQQVDIGLFRPMELSLLFLPQGMTVRPFTVEQDDGKDKQTNQGRIAYEYSDSQPHKLIYMDIFIISSF